MTEAHPALATFRVYRDRDVSGVSGTGVIAEGVQFSTGWVVTHWLDQPPMNEPKTDVWYHKGTGPITKVHGHSGATRIVWTQDEDQANRKLVADIVQAFDVPPEIVGRETEADVIREELARRFRDAADLTERNFLFLDGLGSVPQPEKLIGYLPAYVDAIMPVIEGLIARRDQLRATVGRGYSLAGRWLAAHGSSHCLVRAAGFELRNALSGDNGLDIPADNSSPKSENKQVRPCLPADSDADTLRAVECSAQHHGFPGDHRQCIRAAQHHGDHIDEHGFHWSDTVAVYPVAHVASVLDAPGDDAACRMMVTRTCPPSYNGPCGARPCARIESDDPGPWIEENDEPPCWHIEPGTTCDWNICRQPERLAAGDRGTDPADTPPLGPRLRQMAAQQATGVQHDRPAGDCSSPDHACENCGECVRQHPIDGRCPDASQLPPNQGPLTEIEVRDPCPHCESCPLIPRALMDDHMRDQHPETQVSKHRHATAPPATEDSR
ncbi:hypothetical protein AB0F46_41330 [Streptomyces sp. NPDC026665]|uniref:hypothetical protein n=1 Tax=Streptomyces sp. NPDC026665 TaxID=3154798 RepID=UPI0033F84F0F